MDKKPNNIRIAVCAWLLGMTLMISGLLACIFAPDSSVEIIVSRAAMVVLGWVFLRFAESIA